MWVPMEYNQNMTYLKKITEGVPIWVKVKVVNNGKEKLWLAI